MAKMGTGKWKKSGVPHKGWQCIHMEDLGDVIGVCEMCEYKSIRYVHHMKHPEYSKTIGAGCRCAGNMEKDYANALDRQYEFTKRMKKKK